MIQRCPFATLLLLGCLGCTSAPEAPPSPSMPFHLAILPVSVVEDESLLPSSDESLDITLKLNSETVSQEFARTLSESPFVQVTLLDPPPAGFDEDAYFRESAREIGADLLLRSELRHASQVETEINDRIWYNLLLYSLGGPATYFTNDRTYLLGAELRTQLFDVSRLAREETLLSKGPLVHQSTLTPGELTLDFLDRADSAWTYGASLIIPVAFLSVDNDAVKDEVERGLIRDLASRAVQDLEHHRKGILVAEQVAPFFLHEEARAVRLEDSQVQVQAQAVLRRSDAAIPELLFYEIALGDRPLVRRLLHDVTPVLDPQLDQWTYNIHETVSVPLGESVLRIVVTDSSPEAIERSFSLRIRSHEDPS